MLTASSGSARNRSVLRWLWNTLGEMVDCPPGDPVMITGKFVVFNTMVGVILLSILFRVQWHWLPVLLRQTGWVPRFDAETSISLLSGNRHLSQRFCCHNIHSGGCYGYGIIIGIHNTDMSGFILSPTCPSFDHAVTGWPGVKSLIRFRGMRATVVPLQEPSQNQGRHSKRRGRVVSPSFGFNHQLQAFGSVKPMPAKLYCSMIPSNWARIKPPLLGNGMEMTRYPR